MNKDRPSRLRVLRVIGRMNIGGPAIHVSLLADQLDPERFESLLVTGSPEQTEGDYLALHARRLANVRLVAALGREIRPWRDVSALLELLRIIRAFRPHIVHTHTAKAGALGRLAALLLRVPVIVHTYHGHVLSGYFDSLRTKIFLRIEQALGARSDRLLAVSDHVRRELQQFGIGTDESLQVMPLGLQLDQFTGAERLRGVLRRELGSGEAPLVGIVARLVPIKAHEVFLQAACELMRRRTDVRFVIVGDGERRAALQTMAAQLGISSRCHFLGWRSDLDAIYADLDVVTLTSRNEGTPVSLIEALAAARPVVATAVGGVPDVVEHEATGLLVPSGDHRALMHAIGRLLANPDEGRRMGEAGRAAVTRRFSAARLVADVERLYEDLVERARDLRTMRAHAAPNGSA